MCKHLAGSGFGESGCRRDGKRFSKVFALILLCFNIACAGSYAKKIKATEEAFFNGDVDAAVEVERLHRDQRLVVIHAENGVVGGALLREKGCVGGKRTPHMKALGLQPADCRNDDLDFLAAHAAVFARVGIEAGDCKAGLGDAEEGAECLIGDPRLRLDGLARERARHILEGDVDRDGNGAQAAPHQHHHLGHCMALSGGKAGEIIRVPLVAEARGVERFLLDRAGDHAGGLAGKAVGDRLVNRRNHPRGRGPVEGACARGVGEWTVQDGEFCRKGFTRLLRPGESLDILPYKEEEVSLV